MKIAKNTVERWIISDLKNLDPVAVYLEEIGDKGGKVTFTCWGKAGTAFFGSMGSPLFEFIAECNADYIARKMVEGAISVTDYEKIQEETGETDICRDTALVYADKLREVYGEEWYMDLPTKEDDHFVYVRKICQVIIDAVKQHNTALAA